eukprot:SAG11_NODE_21787_length_418_cov_9.250784_1_plen_71_part_01
MYMYSFIVSGLAITLGSRSPLLQHCSGEKPTFGTKTCLMLLDRSLHHFQTPMTHTGGSPSPSTPAMRVLHS